VQYAEIDDWIGLDFLGLASCNAHRLSSGYTRVRTAQLAIQGACGTRNAPSVQNPSWLQLLDGCRAGAVAASSEIRDQLALTISG